LQEVEQQKKLVSQGWRPAVGSSVYVPRLNAIAKVAAQNLLSLQAMHSMLTPPSDRE